MRFSVVLFSLLLAAEAGCPMRGTDDPAPLPHRPVGVLALEGVSEPSGVVFHAARGTLFVVDDGGVLCEFDPDGKILRRETIRRADFEGVTVDPATGLLYIAIEGEDAILEVDPSTFRALREFPLPRDFQGETLLKKGGQGIEAVSSVGGSRFLVANQGNGADDPAVVLEVELTLGPEPSGPPRILRTIVPGVDDLSALHFDAGRNVIFVISDTMDRLLAISPDGSPLGAWTIPGRDQEGLAVDAEGFLYIAQDSGGVLKLAVDWAEVFKSIESRGDLNEGK